MTSLCFQNRTLVVADKPMEQLLALADKASRSASTVLVCGESGTGKELIARYIHERSPRREKPFISINCAAIPEGLMEAELFGFERGAFTGAFLQRIGKFERANQGTLLLDEVSEMSVGLQAKLLRVLQEGEIDRLGGKETIPVQARVIATTNRDPIRLIEEGKFREDLFYRLNVIRIECLPLRGRPEAILALAMSFLEKSAERQDRGEMALSARAKERLASYHWPGNIRELQNAVERAVLISEGDVVDACHFDSFRERESSLMDTRVRSLAELEQEHILGVLEQTAGNRTNAAKVLGISVRTLRNKLKEYRAA